MFKCASGSSMCKCAMVLQWVRKNAKMVMYVRCVCAAKDCDVYEMCVIYVANAKIVMYVKRI